MVCPSCKAPIPAGKRSCPRCAKSAGSPSRGARPRAPKAASQNSATVILVVVGLLIAAVAAYVLLGKSHEAATDHAVAPKRDPLAGLPAKVRDPKAQLGEDQDMYVNVDPGSTRSFSLEADRAMVAVFDVTPTDGSVFAEARKVQSILTMTPAEAAAFDRSATEVRKGVTSIVHCEAVAQEQVGLFLKNKGTKVVNVRVRKRWWGLEEQAPEPAMEVRTEEKTVPPGGQVEILFHADRRSKGMIEVIPGTGVVSVGMIDLRGGAIGDAEKKQVESQLSSVTAPSVYRREFTFNIGDGAYGIIRNTGEKLAIIQIRYHSGLRR